MDNGDPNFDMNTSYDTSSSGSNAWSMIGGLGSTALGIGNMIGSIASMSGNAHHLTKMRQLARKNFAWQKEAWNQQLGLINEQMEREDNSYQRKVADLKKAGLNPVLAAGGSGSPVSSYKVGNAPQQDLSPHGMAIENNYRMQSVIADLYQRYADVSQTRANIKLINAQKNKAEQEAMALGIQNKYNDQLYSGKVTAQDLDNQLKSGVMQNKIDLEASKLRLSKKEELVKHLEFVVGQKESQLKSIEIRIQELVEKGKISENQILDKKLELLTEQVLHESLVNDNFKWDIDWHHELGIPVGYSAGWVGNLGLLLGSLINSPTGEPSRNLVISWFKSLLGSSDSDNDWAALDKASSYPKGSNILWNQNMNKKSDYGVRRNH